MSLSKSLANGPPFSAALQDSASMTSTSSMLHSNAVPPKSAVLDLSAMQGASRVLHDQFIKDAQVVADLGDMLTIPGMHSSASYTIFPGDYRVPFMKRRHVGIPGELWSHFETPKLECHIGLLPEIERVWISLDNKLFLWDYVEGKHLGDCIEQSNSIALVAVASPKPGVLIDEITHVLIICTSTTVSLMGITAKSVTKPSIQRHTEVKLHLTDISVATGGIEMTSVVNTDDGRIFMCGIGDGNLYELHYQAQEAWFGKRCHLINHSASGVPSFIPLFRTTQTEERIVSLLADKIRNLIYSLSDKSWVSIWKPEANRSLRKVQTMSNLQKEAQDKAPGVPALAAGLNLISLHVISQHETKSSIQLMALSTKGARLYFAAMSYASYIVNPAEVKPLHLLHVRLPPTDLPHPVEQVRPPYILSGTYGAQQQAQGQSRTFVVNGVNISAYMDGVLITSQPGDVDGKDFVVCMAPDLTKISSLGQSQAPVIQPGTMPSYAPSATVHTYLPSGSISKPPLTEQAVALHIEGTIWAIAPLKPADLRGSSVPRTSPEPLSINELALQFSSPHLEFVVVTNTGISHLTKRRAADYLRDALEDFSAEGNLQSIIEFRDNFGRDQTCAMLLALASGNTFLIAIRNASSTYEEDCNMSPELIAVAKQLFYEIGDRPVWIDRGYAADGQGNIFFSGRREGLALYLARLVRPIWNAKITKEGPAGKVSNFDDNILVTIQRDLIALRSFVEKNPQLFSSAPGDQANAAVKQNIDHDAWKIEQTSAQHLQTLLSRTIEAISFVLLLIDYRLTELVAQCDQETQKMISGLTFEELVATQSGLHVSRVLVNAIIDSQIGQQISVDALSEILQQRCGSFCSADDVKLYKAREHVRKAVDIRDPNEKAVTLGESIRLFLQAVRVIDFEKLREITGDYQHLNYARGATELPLRCAAVADEDGLGSSYWSAGCPQNDTRAHFLEKRMQCYDLVLHTLQVFDEQCAKDPANPDLGDVRNCAYEFAFRSDDPIFHSHIYEWMVQQGMTDALLEIRPPFLESHLLREPASTEKYQLLWQLYVKNGQFLRAAEILAALAQSSQFKHSLEQRFEYLTLAVSNAKSHPGSTTGRHEDAIAFLTELEDQLEVAQVQMELLQALLLRIDEAGEVGEKIKLLQDRLFNITELYQFYAEPFDLKTIKLLILHVSEHQDDTIVKPIWNAMFSEVMAEGTPEQQADRLASFVIRLGRRFYPLEYAFSLRHVASLLVEFELSNKGTMPYGWAPRVLKECGVPYCDIEVIFHEMYESQIPPFNEQENIQIVSSDIAIILKDWVEDVRRSPSSPLCRDFSAEKIDRTVTKYLGELAADRQETKSIYEEVKRELRRVS